MGKPGGAKLEWIAIRCDSFQALSNIFASCKQMAESEFGSASDLAERDTLLSDYLGRELAVIAKVTSCPVELRWLSLFNNHYRNHASVCSIYISRQSAMYLCPYWPCSQELWDCFIKDVTRILLARRENFESALRDVLNSTR